jgi:hypothetical protein
VVVDGDETGKHVVAKLRAKYSTWPAGHFATFERSNFEFYYPERFRNQAAAALNKPHNKKPDAKKALCDEVQGWCDASPDQARTEFEASASEVIDILRGIEKKLLGDRPGMHCQ